MSSSPRGGRLSGCVDPTARAQTVALRRSQIRREIPEGLDPALTQKIGIDTNYVAAMEQAARHLPPNAVRPALILFSDGKHDVQGVPVEQVQAAHDRLFGSRAPLALLPVGMASLKERER
jgi:hypothetical protein